MTKRLSILTSGVILLAALTGISLLDARVQSEGFVVLMLVAAGAYVAALV